MVCYIPGWQANLEVRAQWITVKRAAEGTNWRLGDPVPGSRSKINPWGICGRIHKAFFLTARNAPNLLLTGRSLLILLLVLLLVLLCSYSFETCLFPAVSIAIAARQRHLYYIYFIIYYIFFYSAWEIQCVVCEHKNLLKCVCLVRLESPDF